MKSTEVKKKNFFSRIRKLDIDMIWDHDRYMKASPGSILQISDNGLTIFGDLGRKVEYFELVKKYAAKSGFPTFLKNID